MKQKHSFKCYGIESSDHDENRVMAKVTYIDPRILRMDTTHNYGDLRVKFFGSHTEWTHDGDSLKLPEEYIIVAKPIWERFLCVLAWIDGNEQIMYSEKTLEDKLSEGFISEKTIDRILNGVQGLLSKRLTHTEHKFYRLFVTSDFRYTCDFPVMVGRNIKEKLVGMLNSCKSSLQLREADIITTAALTKCKIVFTGIISIEGGYKDFPVRYYTPSYRFYDQSTDRSFGFFFNEETKKIEARRAYFLTGPDPLASATEFKNYKKGE